MTNRERLDKFKTLYKCKEGFVINTAITEEDKFLGVVFKKEYITSKKTGKVDLAEAHIFYCKVKTIQEYVEELTPYIKRIEVLIETV